MSLLVDNDQKPSYLFAFLFSNANVTASLASAAVGMLLSIPFGWDGLIFTGVSYITAEVLGALYIPDLSIFRHYVDRQHRDQQRRMHIDSLLEQLREHSDGEEARHRMTVYEHMTEHVDALEKMVKVRSCSLKASDIDRLRDACRDYLARWLACEAVKERQSQVRIKEVERRLETVEEMLASDRTDIDRRQLEKAQQDYARLIERQRRLASRMMAIDASLLLMPDAIEEVYQHAVSTPMAMDASERLQEAVDRLGIEEELEADIREELQSLSPRATKVVPLTRNPAAVVAARSVAQER